MSRTDKDRPWKIRAEDPTNPLRYWHEVSFTHPCGDGCWYCGWTLPYTALVAPPDWYRTIVWHRPERRRQRDGLRSLRREYNAYNDLLDGDYVNVQARSRAKYWYW